MKSSRSSHFSTESRTSALTSRNQFPGNTSASIEINSHPNVKLNIHLAFPQFEHPIDWDNLSQEDAKILRDYIVNKEPPKDPKAAAAIAFYCMNHKDASWNPQPEMQALCHLLKRGKEESLAMDFSAYKLTAEHL